MREGPRRHRQTWGELMPNTATPGPGREYITLPEVYNRSQTHHCGMTLTIYENKTVCLLSKKNIQDYLNRMLQKDLNNILK